MAGRKFLAPLHSKHAGFVSLSAFFIDDCAVVDELKPTQSTPLNTLLPLAHAKALRLLQQMLQWNPTKRISAESALRDLYLNSYYNPSDEPVCTKQLDITFDEDKVTYLLILVSGFLQFSLSVH